MPTEIQTDQGRAACGGLNLFSVYTDGAAAANERWAVSEIKLLAAQTRLLRSDSWKLNTLLASESMKKAATNVAARADVIVVAIGFLEQRQEHLMRWLDSVVASAADPAAPRLIIGLLGAGDAKPTELDWHVKQLIRCARSLRSEFIWHWMGQDALTDIDFMTESISNLLAAKRSFEPVLAAF